MVCRPWNDASAETSSSISRPPILCLGLSEEEDVVVEPFKLYALFVDETPVLPAKRTVRKYSWVGRHFEFRPPKPSEEDVRGNIEHVVRRVGNWQLRGLEYSCPVSRVPTVRG